ncbi:F0F1 ATP synthase subunit gamma [Elioraea sp. Yellowstone]|jgi:F-type H+-transporting ATPase subunit gamma|uniref:F0F1 ATP synthase subunit gamma n=1 Tax=Elioraea sp. Yellowstone TaxID=2592070 RepID=UPI00114DED5D|nr:F0F1 ATP synthase subunit gamma [Elioraea sp. Yellowstone]TQF82522.1 F0F1 ATP synthase subunit gamma [Elioraea sp. Yellowstone]
MPSLKALRTRINSVRSTRKITQAMKMVAASKLKRAQSQAEQARPYAERMERMLGALAASVAGSPIAPPMLVGTGKDEVHLLVVVSADRGLCGGFNAAVSRFARNRIRALMEQGRTVKILAVGRKGRDYLRREFRKQIVGSIDFVGRKQIGFEDAVEIAGQVTAMLQDRQFDVCTLIYNRFKNVITQVPSEQRLIPASIEGTPAQTADGPRASYEYEPGEEEILAELLPRNLAIQIYRALLESAAGEQGARMTAMDNATRNAGDMIARLTLNYNRQRQANITKELIEIISGAEAI